MKQLHGKQVEDIMTRTANMAVDDMHRTAMDAMHTHIDRKFTISQVLTVVDDHLNPCMKPANKPVATRTVFTTKILDVTVITQALLKTAEKKLIA